MEKEFYARLYKMYVRNEKFEKNIELIEKLIKEHNGSTQEKIQDLLSVFYENTSQYLEVKKKIILLSSIAEVIYRLRTEEQVSFEPNEVEFHLKYFNLVALVIENISDDEKKLFIALNDRVEQALELLNHPKITTHVQLLKTNLKQKSLLLIGHEADSKKAKITNISRMTKPLKLTMIKSYHMYDVEEFSRFIEILEKKEFFKKLEAGYDTQEAHVIYDSFCDARANEHRQSKIYTYEHKKAKPLIYFLKAQSKDDYNVKVLAMVKDLDEKKQLIYKRLLTGESVLSELQLDFKSFKAEQVLSEEERSRYLTKSYLANINEGNPMVLSKTMPAANHILGGLFKKTDTLMLLLAEVNPVEAVYWSGGKRYLDTPQLQFRFEMENQSFSPIHRINASIVEHSERFFGKQMDEFEEWLFGLLEVLSTTDISNPESKEHAIFYAKYLQYRMRSKPITQEEFNYLFTKKNMTPLKYHKSGKETAYKLFEYAQNQFAIDKPISEILNAFAALDETGQTLHYIRDYYSDFYGEINPFLQDMVISGFYETPERAFVDFLRGY